MSQDKKETHITEGQIKSLKSALNQVSGMTDDAHLFIVGKLLHLKRLSKFENIERYEWELLRSKLYPKWRDDSWQLDEGMRIEIAVHLEMYREQELGQKRLFD